MGHMGDMGDDTFSKDFNGEKGKEQQTSGTAIELEHEIDELKKVFEERMFILKECIRHKQNSQRRLKVLEFEYAHLTNGDRGNRMSSEKLKGINSENLYLTKNLNDFVIGVPHSNNCHSTLPVPVMNLIPDDPTKILLGENADHSISDKLNDLFCCPTDQLPNRSAPPPLPVEVMTEERREELKEKVRILSRTLNNVLPHVAAMIKNLDINDYETWITLFGPIVKDNLCSSDTCHKSSWKKE
ncbi:hypothetical protein SNEBB_008410 [Seison nebaliae]|nr:hypothetical protein SNEBB_008410 [Seison nebaliae]